MSASVKLTLDGKPCRLEDLKKDMKARVTALKGDGKPVITGIEAKSK